MNASSGSKFKNFFCQQLSLFEGPLILVQKCTTGLWCKNAPLANYGYVHTRHPPFHVVPRADVLAGHTLDTPLSLQHSGSAPDSRTAFGMDNSHICNSPLSVQSTSCCNLSDEKVLLLPCCKTLRQGAACPRPPFERRQPRRDFQFTA